VRELEDLREAVDADGGRSGGEALSTVARGL
jgi:hypothetical protein